jgi:hypothetical protein
VKVCRFSIEPRGLVFLKGKGDRMAYWVNPAGSDAPKKEGSIGMAPLGLSPGSALLASVGPEQ